MAISFSNPARNEICKLVASLANAGKLRIYDGPNGTGTVLVEMTLSSPAFLPPVNGSLTSNPVSAAIVTNSGTANSWALYTSGGNPDLPNTPIMIGTVGLTGTSADLIIDNTSLLLNQTTAITSFTFVAPL